MMYGDEVIGVIAVQSLTTPGLYTEHERELLSSIANQAASAFRLVQQYQHTRFALEAAETLYTGSARIISASDAQEILNCASGDYRAQPIRSLEHPVFRYSLARCHANIRYSGGSA